MRLALLFISFITLCSACRSSGNNHTGDACSRYITWFSTQKNGMISKGGNERYGLLCMLTTNAYEAIMNAPGNCSELRKSLRKDKPLKQMSFTVKITDHEGNFKRLRSSLSSYIKDGAKNNFRLILGSDTLAPRFYHFENNTSIAPNINFEIGFEVPLKLNHNLHLQYTDALLGIHQTFLFKQQDIKRIPSI